jgi:hypothetical protein
MNEGNKKNETSEGRIWRKITKEGNVGRRQRNEIAGPT